MPVISSIGITDGGELMNVNADRPRPRWRRRSVPIWLLSDVSGILDGKGQRIAEMTAAKAEQLIAGIITDGMIVKVHAALDAARTLGRPVDIASWRHAEQLPTLFNGVSIGTGFSHNQGLRHEHAKHQKSFWLTRAVWIPRPSFRLKENYGGCEVVAFVANIGQDPADLEGVRRKRCSRARLSATWSICVKSLSANTFTRCWTGALYEGTYLLGTSMARLSSPKRRLNWR